MPEGVEVDQFEDCLLLDPGQCTLQLILNLRDTQIGVLTLLAWVRADPFDQVRQALLKHPATHRLTLFRSHTARGR